MCKSMHYEIILKEIGVFAPARVLSLAYLTNYYYLCIVKVHRTNKYSKDHKQVYEARRTRIHS